MPGVALVVDVVSVGLTVVIAGLAATSWHSFPQARATTVRRHPRRPVLIFGWILTIAVLGGYERAVFGAGPDDTGEL